MGDDVMQKWAHTLFGVLCAVFTFTACLISGNDNFGEAAVAAGIFWLVTN